MVVFEAECRPHDAPDAGQHVGDDVNVGLVLGNPDVVVSVEQRHQPVPDGEDAEDVVQDGGDMQHQVGRDEPERDDHRQLRGVIRVAGGRKVSHEANQERDVSEAPEHQRQQEGQHELVDEPEGGGRLELHFRAQFFPLGDQGWHLQLAVLAEVRQRHHWFIPEMSKQD